MNFLGQALSVLVLYVQSMSMHVLFRKPLIVKQTLWAVVFFAGLGVSSAIASEIVQLSSVINATLARNPTLQSSIVSVRAARVESDRADWKSYPSLSADWQRNDQESDQSSIVVSQPLWSGGRISAEQQIAEINWAISNEKLAVLEQSLLSDVSNAFFDVLRETEQELIASHHVSKLDDLVSVIDRRVEASLSPEIDKSISFTRLSLAKIELSEIRQRKEMAFERLYELSGVDYRGRRFSNLSLEDVLDFNQLETDGAIYTPEYRQLVAEARLAEARISQSESEYFPELKANYRKRFGEISAGDLDEEYFLSLTFSSGSGLEKLENSKIELLKLDAIKLEMRAYQQRYFRELREKWLEIQSIRESLPYWKINASATAEIVDSYQRLFHVGKKTWLDVLNAQNETYDAKREALVAELNLQSRSIDLLIFSGNYERLNLESVAFYGDSL